MRLWTANQHRDDIILNQSTSRWHQCEPISVERWLNKMVDFTTRCRLHVSDLHQWDKVMVIPLLLLSFGGKFWWRIACLSHVSDLRPHRKLWSGFMQGKRRPLKPGSHGRQESLSRRDDHSFSPYIAVTRGENEWTSRRDGLSCLRCEPGLSAPGLLGIH